MAGTKPKNNGGNVKGSDKNGSKEKGPAGWPSKEPGKKSGDGRTKNPPK